MIILIATGLYPPESGGPATYTKLLEDRLPALGFTVKVLPFRTVRHLPPVIRHIAYFFACLKQGIGVNIIYAQDTMSVGWPACLAAFLLRKKFVLRVPGDHIWEQGRQRFGITDELDDMKRFSLQWHPYLVFLRILQSVVVRTADAIVVPSEYMKRFVSAWTKPAKVHRIYSSITLPPPVELPADRPEGFLVLSIARPVPWKGLDGLARAAGRDSSWTLKIVNDLPYPQAMGWLKTADVFVLNSTYEGLSHLLVEAMSLGTPIIATRVGGNPELVIDGETGLLIPAKDDDALYAAIKNVHDNPEAARARTAKAMERVKDFSMDKAIQSVASLLKQV
jgi:glycosyltransferase involved in cell wall biosynthesis